MSADNASAADLVRQHLVATALWTASRTLAYALQRGEGLIPHEVQKELDAAGHEANHLALHLMTEEVTAP